jgi:ABC-type multidrug transport system fused ATPase/permease subunit
LILDFKTFASNFDLAIGQIGWNTFYLKNKMRSVVYIIWSLNLLFFIIIVAFISIYIIMYFVIIFNILKALNNKLNEKLGDTLIKDYMKRKIDNLKLLLSFYEKDINDTINELNNVYRSYRENYNQKIKEESKSLRREGKIVVKNKNIECFKSFKTIKNNNIIKYSGKKIYIYILFYL